MLTNLNRLTINAGPNNGADQSYGPSSQYLVISDTSNNVDVVNSPTDVVASPTSIQDDGNIVLPNIDRRIIMNRLLHCDSLLTVEDHLAVDVVASPVDVVASPTSEDSNTIMNTRHQVQKLVAGTLKVPTVIANIDCRTPLHRYC